MYIKIVLENVLGVSKNPQVHSNSSHILWFATKSSTGHKLAEVHRKRAQRVEKPPGTLKFAGKLSPGYERIALHRNSPKKRAQQVEKPPKYTQVRATNYDLWLYRLLGIKVLRCTEIVLENVLSVSRKPPGTVRIARKLSPGHMSLLFYTEVVLQIVLIG